MKRLQLREKLMNIDRFVFAFAGCMILISVTLSQVHHIYWLGLTVFVGFNMLQSAFSGLCPLVWVLKRMGFKPGEAFE